MITNLRLYDSHTIHAERLTVDTFVVKYKWLGILCVMERARLMDIINFEHRQRQKKPLNDNHDGD